MSWRTNINDGDDDEEDEDIPAIVIDNGTSCLRAGYAGEDPQLVFPSVIGTLTSKTCIRKHGKDQFIGDWAHRLRDISSLSYPMEHGIVTDWDVMEKIWQYVFTELHTAPEEHPVLMTEVPLNPSSHREMMAQLLFEGFEVPSLNISIPAVLTIYSAGGRTTGVVVDCGAGVTHIVPVHEGCPILSAIVRLDLAGRDVTELLMEKLNENKGYSFSTASDRETVREIKEKCCYVHEAGLSISPGTYHYTLPGGDYALLEREVRRTAEVLFHPSQYGIKGLGIHEAIQECITNCDIDLCKDLYQNIILSGGSTHIHGFVDRVRDEMEKLSLGGIRTKIIAPPERKYSPYLGGAVIAGLSSFTEMLISRQEYEEYGPSVVNWKFYPSR